ncbi:hypothetical protein [Chitinophaga caeni]|nr:hypothetical protein [Chitinophaga caeni]
MEKINALIDKLSSLKDSNSDLYTISYYSQLLQAEVMHHLHLQQQSQPQAASSKPNIAVIMPSRPVEEIAAMQAQPTPPPPPALNREIEAAQTFAAKVEVAPEPSPEIVDPLPAQKPLETEEVNKETVVSNGAIMPSLFDLAANVASPVTTSPKKPPVSIDIDEDEADGKSLNNSLRKNTVELGQKLGQMSIPDLRKAIGINDKFQYIQELFRGDIAMYDRSVKTINEFTDIHEANNWIERELKLKLGWLEEDHLVQQFYNVVRKRFP